MARYIGKRLLWMIPIIVGIVILIFTLLHIIPGDPARMILGVTATPEQLEAWKRDVTRDGTVLHEYYQGCPAREE